MCWRHPPPRPPEDDNAKPVGAQRCRCCRSLILILNEMHAEYLSSDCATARVHVCTFPTCLITQKATNVAKNTPASLGMHRNAITAQCVRGRTETQETRQEMQRREERTQHKNAVFSLLKPNRLQRENVMSQTDFNLCTYPQRPARAAKGAGWWREAGGGGIAGWHFDRSKMAHAVNRVVSAAKWIKPVTSGRLRTLRQQMQIIK